MEFRKWRRRTSTRKRCSVCHEPMLVKIKLDASPGRFYDDNLWWACERCDAVPAETIGALN